MKSEKSHNPNNNSTAALWRDGPQRSTIIGASLSAFALGAFFPSLFLFLGHYKVVGIYYITLLLFIVSIIFYFITLRYELYEDRFIIRRLFTFIQSIPLEEVELAEAAEAPAIQEVSEESIEDQAAKLEDLELETEEQ